MVTDKTNETKSQTQLKTIILFRAVIKFVSTVASAEGPRISEVGKPLDHVQLKKKKKKKKKESHATLLIKHINNFHADIKFTLEMEVDNVLFLDVLILCNKEFLKQVFSEIIYIYIYIYII